MSKKIAIIGPGIMPIPPDGWGAVEILVWRHKCSLEKLGHEVTIYNTKNLHAVAEHINSSDYDFVHNQYDEFAGFLSQALKVPFCTTTHFGYIMREHLWGAGYGQQVFPQTLRSPSILALSEDIKNMYLSKGYQGKIDYLRNGAEVEEFRFQENGNGKAIVVGKIEDRKRQRDIAVACAGKASVDFVGPSIDPNYRDTETCKHIGHWSKPELYNNLTNYSTLVLFSDGEAAPLVVPEALAAGLSVVVSECASANLDKDLPFVTVVPDDVIQENLPDVINKSCENNSKYRKEIRQLAEDYYDWDVIMQEYVEKIGVTI